MRKAIIGAAAAIAITATMDATGLSDFSALPLLPLLVLFSFWDRLSPRKAGFTIPKAAEFGIALVQPVVVLGAIAILAGASGQVDVASTNWNKAAANFALMAGGTFVIALVTEEGFFRGWMWGSLVQSGRSAKFTLYGTSIAFALWHISPVVFATEFRLPIAQIPLFVVNAGVLGATWGVLRARTGSVVTASLAHGLWNGLVYVMFGVGTKAGALGISDTALFGPEVGLIGLGANLLFLAAFLRMSRNHFANDAIARPRGA